MHTSGIWFAEESLLLNPGFRILCAYIIGHLRLLRWTSNIDDISLHRARPGQFLQV